MTEPKHAGEFVILLHGLGRTRRSFGAAIRRLRRAGYRPLSLGYPSTREPIAELAQRVRDRLPDEPGCPMHFLTHSLGGIVLRYLVTQERPANLGRVVMLSPPNQGSQLAASLKPYPIYGWILGPTGQQLAAGESSVPTRLGPVDFEVGVIAGDRPRSPMRHLIEGPNDGTVSVEETRVEGMQDFLVVPRGHTFIMNDPEVIDQAIHFFRYGKFARQSTASE